MKAILFLVGTIAVLSTLAHADAHADDRPADRMECGSGFSPILKCNAVSIPSDRPNDLRFMDAALVCKSESGLAEFTLSIHAPRSAYDSSVGVQVERELRIGIATYAASSSQMSVALAVRMNASEQSLPAELKVNLNTGTQSVDLSRQFKCEALR